jgi:hypothetical protein
MESLINDWLNIFFRVTDETVRLNEKWEKAAGVSRLMSFDSGYKTNYYAIQCNRMQTLVP